MKLHFNNAYEILDQYILTEFFFNYGPQEGKKACYYGTIDTSGKILPRDKKLHL